MAYPESKDGVDSHRVVAYIPGIAGLKGLDIISRDVVRLITQGEELNDTIINAMFYMVKRDIGDAYILTSWTITSIWKRSLEGLTKSREIMVSCNSKTMIRFSQFFRTL